jgi:CubicO group peptidase (beta-lactamase class C family)
MGRKSLVITISLLLLFMVSPGQSKFPDTPEGKIAGEYLRIFNAGDEPALRNFFTTNVAEQGLKERPIETRIERFRTLRNDLKSFEFQRVLGATEIEINVLVKSGTGEMLTLGFMFEPQHKLSGIRVLMGEASPEENGPPLSKKELTGEIERFLAQYVKDDKYSGTVLVARNQDIIFKHAYGSAEKRFNTLNTIETKYNLGSINKFFTRLAIAQLAQAGKLSFDDRLIHDLPDYPNKSIAEKITIKQLLDMTSGLGDFFNQKYETTPKEKIRTLTDYLSLFVNDTLLFEPGTNHHYSNAGYIVLGLVIEKISGENYYSYIRENIFKPARMMNTDWYPMDGITPNLATGYTHPESDSVIWISNIYSAPGLGSSAGGGYSTVDDLYKFIQALRNGKLLSPKYSAWMVTGEVPVRDPDLPLKKGDFGIAGGAPGINAAVEFDAVSGDLIIALGNYDPPSAVGVAKKIRGLLKRMK